MNRRDFVACAVGAIPWLAAAREAEVGQPGLAIVVRAGTALADDVLKLGDRSRMHFKVRGGETQGGALILEHRELRRFGPPRHLHFAQDEWFYPLAGTFLFEVGEERFELHPGDFLFAPRGVPHVWMHVEEEQGRVMVGFHPAGAMEDFFRKFTAGGALPTPEALPELFAAHGMKIVGPPLTASAAR